MLTRKDTYSVEQDSSLIDFILEKCLFFHTKEEVLAVCKEQRLFLDGKVCSGDEQVTAGQQVELHTDESKEPPVNEDVEIIEDNENFVVVNKPAPLPAHPAGKYYFHTLTSILERKFNIKQADPIQRLDRETTGAALLAKNKEWTALLHHSPSRKKYLAVVFGDTPKEGMIDVALSKKTQGEIRNHMVIDKEGKPSVTAFQTLESKNGYSLVEIELITGRRHQIRAHMAYLGHPLVGDKQYGKHPELMIKESLDPKSVSHQEVSELLGASRQLLHCKELSFVHPKDKKELTFKAPLPADMKDFLSRHGFSLI